VGIDLRALRIWSTTVSRFAKTIILRLANYLYTVCITPLSIVQRAANAAPATNVSFSP
jgi:hypothetical protein